MSDSLRVTIMSAIADIAKEAGGLSLTSLAHEHQLRVLKWLDENVDQAPGRTMTASEFGNSEIAERVRSELYGEFAGKGGRSAD